MRYLGLLVLAQGFEDARYDIHIQEVKVFLIGGEYWTGPRRFGIWLRVQFLPREQQDLVSHIERCGLDVFKELHELRVFEMHDLCPLVLFEIVIPGRRS